MPWRYIPVEFNPIDVRKVEAALARIKSQAQGVNFGKGAESIGKLSKPLGRINGQVSEFQKSLEASNARVLAFGASVLVINKLSEAFASLITNTVKVEATFAKINIILGGTTKELEKFGNGIFRVAQQTATSFDQVAEGALELARQGLGVEESLSRVETALKLVRVAGIDSQKAVSGLTAAIKGFESQGLTVAKIADKLAEVDTKFAVSTEDLINGLERASASARVAGVSLDELLAVVTTVQERTQRGGAVIGNAFKTIFARLGKTDTLKTLQDLGINVLDTSGNVRSAIPLFQELATELDKIGLSSVQAGDIIQKVAGVRQRDILISLVEDLNSGQSQFAKALSTSSSAVGSLDSKNQALNDTLETLINNLAVGGQKLASVLGETGFADGAKDLLKLFSGVVSKITDLLQGDSLGSKFAQGLIKGIGGVLGPGVALVGAIFIKLFAKLTAFGVGALKQILGINAATQAQASLQNSVFQTLLQNESVQREILALEGNKIAQEQLLLKIYNQQIAALARVQKISAAVAPGLYGAGLRGGEKGVTRPRGKASGGYIASESRDVSRGVGGAPSSAKVVSIPNFAFGGGKRGTMVANTSEYVVPNYAGGGDAIFNQDMVKTMGLPAGAKKLNAAGGFIPNFNKNIYIRRGTNTEQLQKKAAQGDKQAQEALAIRSGRRGNAFNAESKGIVMLVPQTNIRGAPLDTVFKKPKLGKRGTYNSFIGKAFGIDPNLKNDSKFGSLVGLDDELESAMAQSINTIIGKVYPSIKTSPTPPITSKAAKQKFLQEGGSGAFGSFRGAMFEAIIEMIVGGSGRDGAGTLDVAFNSVNTAALSEIFGLPKKYKVGDYKNSVLSKGKFIDQAISNRGAGGYIPNFAGGALEEAVSREKDAGLPLNQIRINQSGKLRNSQNPQGLAVTNTRDEPTGAIPNFAKGDPAGLGGGGGGALTTIFLIQSLSAMTSSFTEADSALQRMINVVTTGVTAMAGLSLLGPTIQKASTSLSLFATNAKKQAALAPLNKRGGKGAATAGRSLAGRGAGALAGALRFAGPAAMVASIAVPLVLELTKVESGFKKLNTELDKVDLSGLNLGSPEAIRNLFKTLDDNIAAEEADKESAKTLKARPGQTADQRITELVNGLQGIPKNFKGEDATFIRSAVQLVGPEKVQKLIDSSRGTIEEKTNKKFEEREALTGFEGFLNKANDAIFGGVDREAVSKSLAEDVKVKPGLLFDPKKFEKLFSELQRTDDKIADALKTDAQKQVEADPTKVIASAADLKQLQREGQSKKFSGIEQNFTKTGLSVDLDSVSSAGRDILAQQQKELRLASDLGRLERERLEADKAILDFKIKQTEASRKLGEQLGSEVAKAADGTVVDKASYKTLLDSIAAGEDFETVLEKANKLKENGNIKDTNAYDSAIKIINSYKEQNKELVIQQALSQQILEKQSEVAKLSPLERANIARGNELRELTEEVPARMADNLESSLASTFDSLADGSYDSIGNAFLNIALDFGQALQKEMSAAVAKSLVKSFTGSGIGQGISKGIGSIFSNFNSGGLVTGGGGVKDDVPAKLTGGEFVVKKSAVQKYGVGFLDKLNSGGIKGMQDGGFMPTQGADNTRTGKFWSNPKGYRAGGAQSNAYLREARKRDFFIPGQRGFGSIVGKENLLAFSQQQVTSGRTDVISSGPGGASINLEDQSVRLTAWGRRRDSPARRALKDAQAQAFDLYNQSVAEENRVIQENKDAKKARSSAFKQAIIGSFVNATMAGASAYFQSASAEPTIPTPSTSVNSPTAYSASGSIIPNANKGTPIAASAGSFSRYYSEVNSMPSPAVAPSYSSWYSNNLTRGSGNVSPNMFNRANGGSMFGGANALLMDGEYVMSGEAASSLGSETLNNINATNFSNGGSVKGSTASNSKSADVGQINIEINIDNNGKAQASTSDSGGEDSQKAKEFSRKIKDVVLNVINEEKRVSGSLFTRVK